MDRRETSRDQREHADKANKDMVNAGESITFSIAF